MTGRKLEAPCNMYWPDRYSGVAPDLKYFNNTELQHVRQKTGLNILCQGTLKMYRNVPMGTEESKMTRPTFDHFPNGSRFTPLLIKALK